MTTSQTRHAELVSASISRHGASACGARWTLKQVQGDDGGEAAQALCFMVGANSIFTGDKLLTAPNAGDDADGAMFARLGLSAMSGEEPMRACAVLESVG